MKGRDIDLLEKIDERNLGNDQENQVFDQLHILNRLTMNQWLIKMQLRTLATYWKDRSKEKIRVLDLGCADGNQLYDICDFLKKEGFKVSGKGYDFNSNLIEKAMDNYKDPQIDFQTKDLLNTDIHLEQSDLIFTSQFIYRLSDENFKAFIVKRKKEGHDFILFSELNRSRILYLLFFIIGKLPFFDPIVYSDGLKAIRRSWSFKDFRKLLGQCGMSEYKRINMFHRFSVLCRF